MRNLNFSRRETDALHIGAIETDMQPANCAFAGPDGKLLIITARTSIYQVQMPVPGVPIHSARRW